MMREFSAQLALDLTVEAPYQEEDFFLSPSNEAAFQAIQQWPHWSHHSLLLYGPKGCGKTHLAHLWQNKSEAHFLKDVSVTDFYPAAGSAWIWDQGLDPSQEKSLLHFYNLTREHQAYLLIVAETALSQMRVQLPDLRSRLAATPSVEMKAPDDMLLRAVILKHFSDYQLKVADPLVTYMLRHMDRSFESAQCWCQKINAYSLKHKRNVTLPLVRSVMEGG